MLLGSKYVVLGITPESDSMQVELLSPCPVLVL